MRLFSLICSLANCTLTTRYALHTANRYKIGMKRAKRQVRQDVYHGRSEQHLTVKCAWFRIAKIFLPDNDTPALNALKALRGAPTSMGRGETPVERQPTAIRFCRF